MNRSFLRCLMFALTVIGLAGCQSGPRWAWWKRDQAPADSSAIAGAAVPPVLPSSQATPTAVAGTGIQPATPPSSANLAAAGSTAAPSTPLGAAGGSAAYPTTGTPALASPASLTTASATMAPTAVAGASVPPTGPYDPNAYRMAAAAGPASAAQAASDAADRYGTAAAAPNDNRYGSAIATAPTDASSYGTPTSIPSTTPTAASADRYGIMPVTGGAPGAGTSSAAAPPAAAAGVAQSPSRYDMTPPAASEPPGQYPGTQVAASAGQYRPGGTSNYEGPGSHIEVATRPTTPAAPPTGGTATPPATYPGMPTTGQQPY